TLNSARASGGGRTIKLAPFKKSTTLLFLDLISGLQVRVLPGSPTVFNEFVDMLRAGYSYLSATMGSTFVARRAGMKQAAIATMTSSAPTATIVTRSEEHT